MRTECPSVGHGREFVRTSRRTPRDRARWRPARTCRAGWQPAPISHWPAVAWWRPELTGSKTGGVAVSAVGAAGGEAKAAVVSCRGGTGTAGMVETSAPPVAGRVLQSSFAEGVPSRPRRSVIRLSTSRGSGRSICSASWLRNRAQRTASRPTKPGGATRWRCSARTWSMSCCAIAPTREARSGRNASALRYRLCARAVAAARSGRVACLGRRDPSGGAPRGHRRARCPSSCPGAPVGRPHLRPDRAGTHPGGHGGH